MEYDFREIIKEINNLIQSHNAHYPDMTSAFLEDASNAINVIDRTLNADLTESGYEVNEIDLTADDSLRARMEL